MTLNEISTLIASRFDRQLDDGFKAILIDMIHYWRARLLRQTLEKNPVERRWFVQTLELPMTAVNQIDSNVFFDKYKIAETSNNIPYPIRANNILFDYCGSVDGMNAFQYTQTPFLKYLRYNKYQWQFTRYVYENNVIRIYGNKDIPVIRVDGIFENPQYVYEFVAGIKDKSYIFFANEYKYPCSLDVIQAIVQNIISVDFGRGSLPEDEQIDLNEDLITKIQKLQNERGSQQQQSQQQSE